MSGGTASGKTVLWVADNYPGMEINLIESSYTIDQKLLFTRLQFQSHDELLTHLRDIQMTETDIINTIKV
ncbi:MAG: hypothetical protein WDZ94_04060 [Patescibacteria group bacterium]